jgi:hypothetical protein
VVKRQRPGLPPVKTRIKVLRRQFQEPPAQFDGEANRDYLERLLCALADAKGCERADLRLDHDPMLRVRKYNPNKKVIADRYTPHAHDPDCLLYRPQPPEFEGSHHVKTYVRGERGQFSDTMLANRERKRERKAKTKPKYFKAAKKVWPSRPFPKGRGFNATRK